MLEHDLFITLLFKLRPTRVTGFSDNLIDHIWFNDNNYVRNSGIILSGVTDHFPICVYKLQFPSDSKLYHICLSV